jgi:hypothetical protein
MVWIIQSHKRYKGGDMGLPMRFERGGVMDGHFKRKKKDNRKTNRCHTRTYKQQPLPVDPPHGNS